jgi:hypothetical protein
MSFENFLVRGKIDDFYDLSQNVAWLLSEVEKKRKLTPFWQKKIRFSYAAHNKRKNKKPNYNSNNNNQNIKEIKEILQLFYQSNEMNSDYNIDKDKKITEKTFRNIIPAEEPFRNMHFFRRKHFLDDIFKFYLTRIFPFKANQLKRRGYYELPPRDLMIDYTYDLSFDEISSFEKYRNLNKINNEPLERIIEYFFSALVHALGILLNEVIQDNFKMEMMCGRAEINNTDSKIVFTISLRQREAVLTSFYLKTHIFHFSELFQQIPKDFKNKLRIEKDLIYLLAMSRYSTLAPYVLSVNLRFYKKCIMLGHITPILGYCNYVLSRVEDSLFNTEALIKEEVKRMRINQTKSNAFMQLFRYINKNSALFSTFQTINRSQLLEQYRFFIFYIQGFLHDGLNELFNPDIESNIYFPSIFNEKIKNLFNSNPNFRDYKSIFYEFEQGGFEIIQNSALDEFFKNVFLDSVRNLNEEFFRVFSASLNLKFVEEISNINLKLKNEQITFEDFIDFFQKLLYNLSKKIFLKKNPVTASKGFRDQVGRYSPKNMALRALELLMFQELPLSDNNWENYTLSRNRSIVTTLFKKYITIPDDFFFSNKNRLHISGMVFYGLDKSVQLENWLVDRIVEPFFIFVDVIINNLIKEITENELKSKTEILNSLINIIMQRISGSIIDQQVRENLELISEWIAENSFDSILKILLKRIGLKIIEPNHADQLDHQDDF